MRYRINDLEKVQRREFEEARASLEEMADQKVKYLTGAEDALLAVGFKKEPQLPHSFIGPILNYSRETAEGIELLVDRDLTNMADKTPHLYRLPAGMDILDWYESIPEKKLKHGRMIASCMSLAAIVFGAPGTILFSKEFGLLLAVAAANEAYSLVKGSALDGQTVASGKEALHYIADSASFEDHLRDDRLRIEADIIDAEFTDKKQKLILGSD